VCAKYGSEPDVLFYTHLSDQYRISDKVSKSRNDVMHFDQDGLEREDMRLLREFARFLRRLREVGAT
jgi:hypothetical protein